MKHSNPLHMSRMRVPSSRLERRLPPQLTQRRENLPLNFPPRQKRLPAA